jgi:16S rRNA processing protein RimM
VSSKPDPRDTGESERVCPEEFSRTVRPEAVHAERVTVAVIRKPQGRHGEVLAEILSDFPQRLLHGRQVFLWNGRSAASEPAVITSGWLHKGGVVFQLEGCTTRAQAEKLRGWHVQIPKAERVELPAASYYTSDLMGCEVYEQTPGGARLIGSVQDVVPTGETVAGPHVLSVETRQGELLIPFAQEICTRIDIAGRRIEVLLPKGLRELSREE